MYIKKTGKERSRVVLIFNVEVTSFFRCDERKKERKRKMKNGKIVLWNFYKSRKRAYTFSLSLFLI